MKKRIAYSVAFISLNLEITMVLSQKLPDQFQFWFDSLICQFQFKKLRETFETLVIQQVLFLASSCWTNYI